MLIQNDTIEKQGKHAKRIAAIVTTILLWTTLFSHNKSFVIIFAGMSVLWRALAHALCT